ncbi:hypothetical protein [Paenibacillus amylolyticus]|uniref:HTH cro/C1-type domain-containing protein n=1 Tax=Paenibacillus amylolyticus TaxID=1451 RepID=A0ABD8AU96_PAEAM
MEMVPTIRAHIEKNMREQNLKLQHFSDITGINVGTLSAILKGSIPMSMNPRPLEACGTIPIRVC